MKFHAAGLLESWLIDHRTLHDPSQLPNRVLYNAAVLHRFLSEPRVNELAQSILRSFDAELRVHPLASRQLSMLINKSSSWD